MVIGYTGRGALVKIRGGGGKLRIKMEFWDIVKRRSLDT